MNMEALVKAKHSSREMIAKAKNWIAEQFADEEIRDIGLEEILFEDDTWHITIGFQRKRHAQRHNLFKLIGTPISDRTENNEVFEFTLKIVLISDHSGEVISMRDRIKE